MNEMLREYDTLIDYDFFCAFKQVSTYIWLILSYIVYVELKKLISKARKNNLYW